MEPLQTIAQYADILLQRQDKQESRSLLKAIKYCNRMVQFNIRDLEDVSNLSSRRFQIKNDRVDIRKLIADTIKCQKIQASKKKQQIVPLIDDSVPRFIESDPTRLQQIVNNLLGNAIKFSDESNRIDIEVYYQSAH